MSTDAATTTRAGELRHEIEQAEHELKSLTPGPGLKDDIDRLHGQLRALNVELAQTEPPVPPVSTVTTTDIEPERVDLSTPEGAQQFDAILNESSVPSYGPRERLAALRDERGRIPDLPKNAARFEVIDAEIVELVPLVEQDDRDIAEAEAARALAAANTPESLAAVAIRELESSRSVLALRLLQGDATAQAEYDTTEAKIAETHRQVELRKFARHEQERLAREAAKEAEAAAEAERQARADFLKDEWGTRMDGVMLAIAALRDRVRGVVEIDREIVVTSEAGQGCDDLVVVLAMIALQDAGVNRRSLPALPFNAERAKLLELWPIPESSVSATAKIGRKCSVCEYERRDEVERALANGTPVAEIVSAHEGLSRHAIARHRDHVEDAA